MIVQVYFMARQCAVVFRLQKVMTKLLGVGKASQLKWIIFREVVLLFIDTLMVRLTLMRYCLKLERLIKVIAS